MWICLLQDGVFCMSLNPDGTLLAVIHFSGRLSLWDFPSLKQRATWNQDQQVLLGLTCGYTCTCMISPSAEFTYVLLTLCALDA